MYQPLIKFHPYPAIITQVLIIFAVFAGYYLVRPFRPVSGIVILIFPVYSLFPGYGISIRNSYLCVLLIT